MRNKDDLAKKIGSRIKELRSDSALTQKVLAGVTGLSPALISRIENGLSMPSIPTLQIIADSLKTEIGFFFAEREEKGYILSHVGERREVVSRSGPHGKIAYVIELLTEGMENFFMEPFIVTLVGEEGAVESRTHNGQEFMYVLEGRTCLTLGSKEFILRKGDAAYWNGSVPHKAIGLTNRPTRSLHVHLMPGKWTRMFQLAEIPDGRLKLRQVKKKPEKKLHQAERG
jgi:transcriptional regulator with XRE-family HTH domain